MQLKISGLLSSVLVIFSFIGCNVQFSHVPGDRIVKTINGVDFAFRWCPAGKFTMGSPASEKERNNNETQHEVTITQGFWMMETEVTQKQWTAVMETNPSTFKDGGDSLPVESISWDDCQEFCRRCVEAGLPMSLPTEAQWEYACRAGSAGPYAGNLDEMAWYRDNCNDTTHPVGMKKANAWGLYDMHGNVSEWTVSEWAESTDQKDQALRGGSLRATSKHCRSAYRHYDLPKSRYFSFGVRFVLNEQ